MSYCLQTPVRRSSLYNLNRIPWGFSVRLICYFPRSKALSSKLNHSTLKQPLRGISQQEFLYFSSGSSRDLPEYEMFGYFKRGQVFAAERAQLARGDVFISSEFHESAGNLAPLFIRLGNYSSEGYGRMPMQNILDL